MQIERLEKFRNFVGEDVESTGHFPHEIRRAQTGADSFRVCEAPLHHHGLMALDSFTVPLAKWSGSPAADTTAGDPLAAL